MEPTYCVESRIKSRPHWLKANALITEPIPLLQLLWLTASQHHYFVLRWWTNTTKYLTLSSIYFSGCSLLFNRERVEDPLKVFRNSSSARFKAGSLPVESCNLATRTYYGIDQVTQPWKQLETEGQAFYIRHENRGAKRHAHFLEVSL